MPRMLCASCLMYNHMLNVTFTNDKQFIYVNMIIWEIARDKSLHLFLFPPTVEIYLFEQLFYLPIKIKCLFDLFYRLLSSGPRPPASTLVSRHLTPRCRLSNLCQVQTELRGMVTIVCLWVSVSREVSLMSIRH